MLGFEAVDIRGREQDNGATESSWLDRDLWVRFAKAVQKIVVAGLLLGAHFGFHYVVHHAFKESPRILQIADVLFPSAFVVIEARLVFEMVQIFLRLPKVPFPGARSAAPMPLQVAFETAFANMRLVVNASVEIKQLHAEKIISDDQFLEASEYYERWAAAQNLLAVAVTARDNATLSPKLADATREADGFLGFVLSLHAPTIRSDQ